MIKISENIRKFRELKGITREQLASDLGMSTSGYSKIERGEVDLSISKIHKISEVLGVEISEILNFDATTIFNVQHNSLVQGTGAKAENMHFHSDEYKDKYIKMLEKEIERLNAIIQSISKKN
jgi:transcriptional regulator with XRE-family HTH domain